MDGIPRSGERRRIGQVQVGQILCRQASGQSSGQRVDPGHHSATSHRLRAEEPATFRLDHQPELQFAGAWIDVGSGDTSNSRRARLQARVPGLFLRQAGTGNFETENLKADGPYDARERQALTADVGTRNATLFVLLDHFLPNANSAECVRT